MEYYIAETNFKICAANIAAAVQAVKALSGNFSDIDDFASLIKAWGLEVQIDKNGNIEDIFFADYYHHSADEDVLFYAIAPYVEKDSFIEIHGEDGEMWRYVFDGTSYEEIYPTITW